MATDPSTKITTKLRIGIIGAGGIAQVSHLPNLTSLPNVELAAVCDLNQGRAAVISQRFGIKHWYDEPERMLKKEHLDGVIITTPTFTHLPLLQLACESGAHVLVEKPFARNTAEARRMVEIAERTGKKLLVGMNHRFRNDTTQLRNLLSQRFIGDVISIRAGWLKQFGVWSRPQWFTDRRSAGGGVLMDLGVQMIDLVLYLMNFPTVVESACSTSYNVLGLDVEDTAVAYSRFADGSSMTLNVSWASFAEKDTAFTMISGSHGEVSMNPLIVNIRQQEKVVTLNPYSHWDETEAYRRSYFKELFHFTEVVAGKAEPVSTGGEAVQVLDLVERLYNSAGH